MTVGCSLGQYRVEWPEACPVWGRTAKAAVDATVGGRQEACRDHSQSVRAPVEAGGGLQHARCRLERNGEQRGVGREGQTFVSIDEQHFKCTDALSCMPRFYQVTTFLLNTVNS